MCPLNIFFWLFIEKKYIIIVLKIRLSTINTPGKDSSFCCTKSQIPGVE